MGKQAPTFEQSGVRYPEDIPVMIPCLQDALTILAQQDEDPDVFQSLMFFFSSLLSGLPFRRSSDDSDVTYAWTVLRKDLDNPYGLCYGGTQARRQVDAVIGRLDPIATFQQLQQSAQVHLRGLATSRSYPVGEDYVFMNRGHDWLVRCAFVLDISDKWKLWLQLMYEKQPYKILDLPSASISTDKGPFIDSLHTAANIGGFDAMIPVIKFWLRQALTIVQVWDVRLRIEGDTSALMPSYDWCVGAYQKMWYRFQNEVRNPLSEYPYTVRQELLHDIYFVRVFETCWKWIALATQDIDTQEFDPCETRMELHELEEAFGTKTEDNGYLLLAESPVVNVDSLDNDLRPRRFLYDGLCQGFYPHLPNSTEAEFEVMYADSMGEEPERYEDQSDESELTLFEDVELEAFGPPIDIGQFTQTKEPDKGDFCTICQEDIGKGESDKQRCLVPLTCSDTFHAECLDAWTNSAAKTGSHCPHCKTQMTELQRLIRAVKNTDEDTDEDMGL